MSEAHAYQRWYQRTGLAGRAVTVAQSRIKSYIARRCTAGQFPFTGGLASRAKPPRACARKASNSLAALAREFKPSTASETTDVRYSFRNPRNFPRLCHLWPPKALGQQLERPTTDPPLMLPSGSVISIMDSASQVLGQQLERLTTIQLHCIPA